MCQLGKIPMRLHGTNLCINAPFQPVLHRVLSINETLPNAPKHYENASKHEFRVQWGGSRAFVAKNSNAISWHELLH